MSLVQPIFDLTPYGAAGDFASLVAVIYLAMVALYFALGGAIAFVNSRNPERRIQPKRQGEARKWVEIRTSMVSILVTSVCLAGGLYAQAQGWALQPLSLNWLSAPAMLLVTVVAFDGWFYAGHRLMHNKHLYRWHLWHHRSVAPTVWSTFSDDPLDTLVMQGFYLAVPFVLPVPPEILIAHRLIDHVNGTIGHCGFEYLASPLARWPSPMLCTVFHDQHHSGFRHNFANYFSIWDRVFGTIHPDYDRAVERLEKKPAIRLWR